MNTITTESFNVVLSNFDRSKYKTKARCTKRPHIIFNVPGTFTKVTFEKWAPTKSGGPTQSNAATDNLTTKDTESGLTIFRNQTLLFLHSTTLQELDYKRLHKHLLLSDQLALMLSINYVFTANRIRSGHNIESGKQSGIQQSGIQAVPNNRAVGKRNLVGKTRTPFFQTATQSRGKFPDSRGK